MSDDEIAWVAAAMIRFDAIACVVWMGRFGPQPVLFPRSLLYGAATPLHTA